VAMGRLDRRSEAVTYSRRAVEIQQRTQGPEHPLIALSLVNLGSSLRHAGELAEAESVLLESLALHTAIWGDDHSRTEAVRGNLADVYDQLGQPDAAARYRPPPR